MGKSIPKELLIWNNRHIIRINKCLKIENLTINDT